MEKPGKIYMLPTSLGNENLKMAIPLGVMEILKTTKYFAVENIRTTRRYLKLIDKEIIIDELKFFDLTSKTNIEDIQAILSIVIQGNNLGVVSEAGCPGIADPGAALVCEAHVRKIEVIPMVGPSSILMGLIASGMNGQNFAFNGYLPVKNPARVEKIIELEKKVFRDNQTQLFMETPYRNNALLGDILNSCRPDLKLCIAADITMESEYVATKSISEWKKYQPDLHKRPAIFIIGR